MIPFDPADVWTWGNAEVFGPNSDTFESYIRLEFSPVTLSDSGTQDNTTRRSLTTSLGPTLTRVTLTDDLQ